MCECAKGSLDRVSVLMRAAMLSQCQVMLSRAVLLSSFLYHSALGFGNSKIASGFFSFSSKMFECNLIWFVCIGSTINHSKFFQLIFFILRIRLIIENCCYLNFIEFCKKLFMTHFCVGNTLVIFKKKKTQRW